MCSCMACSIQRGLGQLPMPMTDSGRIAGAAAGSGSLSRNLTATSSTPMLLLRTVAAPALRSANLPLATMKLRCLATLVNDTNSLPVMRHQAGRSSSTEISVERISSKPPRSIGSICFRISSNRPLPQSRSPPSKLTSAWWVWVSMGVMSGFLWCARRRRLISGNALDPGRYSGGAKALRKSNAASNR